MTSRHGDGCPFGLMNWNLEQSEFSSIRRAIGCSDPRRPHLIGGSGLRHIPALKEGPPVEKGGIGSGCLLAAMRPICKNRRLVRLGSLASIGLAVCPARRSSPAARR